ncbi:hypothetical protein M407DRAFT_28475 [Tulasnella calospora MUT 4182]|uniref:Uncharacterized protein n=1 Tax=Tulasnella calospora MUT 4182 TaxID=1051891 RepID=A0A0C3LKP8_9AGAM|nr:hypothetical protein M407DRAFT_28475 [Tulasnella calospora MUT 4182]
MFDTATNSYSPPLLFNGKYKPVDAAAFGAPTFIARPGDDPNVTENKDTSQSASPTSPKVRPEQPSLYPSWLQMGVAPQVKRGSRFDCVRCSRGHWADDVGGPCLEGTQSRASIFGEKLNKWNTAHFLEHRPGV